MSLQDKVAVVTGAASGIGLATAVMVMGAEAGVALLERLEALDRVGSGVGVEQRQPGGTHGSRAVGIGDRVVVGGAGGRTRSVASQIAGFAPQFASA